MDEKTFDNSDDPPGEMNRILKLLLFFIVVLLVILTTGLLVYLVICHRRMSHPNDEAYMAVAELLLVIVIAIEGLVAVWEFAQSPANAAVFDLYKMYLSIDYHKNVRRPAWYSFSLARRDQEYRIKLLKGLAGEMVDDVAGYIESIRSGRPLTDEAKKSLLVHDDYHRVQDILGFFITLSLLNSDSNTLQMCNFFYDRWRVPLHKIVHDLGEYSESSAQGGEIGKELKRRRYLLYKDALGKLDKKFGFALKKFDWKSDLLSKNLTVSE